MWMFILVGAPLIAVVAIRIIYRLQSGVCHSTRRLDGKTVLITGSSAGIGKEAAKDLASRGARVILACRNLEKAQKVADGIIENTGNKNVVVRQLDVSDLSSVRQFAKNFIETEEYLHVLVNNAGMAGSKEYKMTGDGLEVTMATNHYGHFLLTCLLIKMLKKSAPSRIINVSSLMHKFCTNLDPEDLNFEKSYYRGYHAYNQSKLCNILFTLELSEKLKNTGITVNSLHPGVVATEITGRRGFSWIHILFHLMGKDSQAGAQTTIHLAVADEVENTTGKYFVDCKETDVSQLAKHRGMAKKLWLASELDVKLQPEEFQF